MSTINLEKFRNMNDRELILEAFERIKKLYKGSLKYGTVLFQVHNGECVRVLVEPRVRVMEYQNRVDAVNLKKGTV